jgi:SUF system for Fe-S cluster assembly SufBD-like protein
LLQDESDFLIHLQMITSIPIIVYASTIPIVGVFDPEAKVTHEVAIGRVNKKGLETLMARWLAPEQAVEPIVSGILRSARLSVCNGFVSEMRLRPSPCRDWPPALFSYNWATRLEALLYSLLFFPRAIYFQRSRI